ncbi:hypothetical protein E4U35_000712, partial [Claviceps purpurea]
FLSGTSQGAVGTSRDCPIANTGAAAGGAAAASRRGSPSEPADAWSGYTQLSTRPRRTRRTEVS